LTSTLAAAAAARERKARKCMLEQNLMAIKVIARSALYIEEEAK
jgi:hypothetical protein